ncbi:MAG: SDR family NAD(P)-dependent oxidoreductase [Polyangia bacterium]|jgi:3-oxoacyl-[acyl-carrier protein] reductase|nr:SDR family NAD(P)-dependent oxidoreductase [Polyangia bacterium]
MQIKDKVVVITGGAQGIGFAIAEHFAKHGAKLVLGDIKQEELDTAVAALEKLGAKACGVLTNVSKEADAENLMKQAVDRFGRLDVAILNAGILRDGLLIKVDKDTGKVAKKMSLEQWQVVIDVNLTGVFLTGREAAAQMINCGNGGVLILMSSIAGEGNFGQTNYAATKAGVRAMTVTWARELSRFGIRAMSVAPGFIGTPMVKRDMKQEALEMLLKRVPAGRLGEPEEVALMCQFIVENDFATAECWGIHGGMRL